MSAVLEVTDIKKNFGGISAVDGVSFDVREGEILGLIGPNGCGKSTLFNCILGQLTPSRGEVKLDGKLVTGLRPAELNQLGVIGPTGCAKSPFFNCILGKLPPSRGEFRLDGRLVPGRRPAGLNKRGVSRT